MNPLVEVVGVSGHQDNTLKPILFAINNHQKLFSISANPTAVI